MFGVHWSSASEYVTYLICHVIEASYDVMDWSFWLYVTVLPGLLAIDIVVVEIECF